jgi:type I restriction enzyme, S subunit
VIFYHGWCPMTEEWVPESFGAVVVRRTESWAPGDPDTAYIGLEHIIPHNLRLESVGFSSTVSSNKARFAAGDVLFGKLRPYFRKVVRPDFPGVCSTDIWPLYSADDSRLDQRYLHWVVADPTFSEFANAAETGTRMPRASWQWVSDYALHLPPLSEQRRIAEVLNALDDRIGAARSLVEVLETCIQLEAAAAAQSADEETQRLPDVATITNGYSYKSSELVDDSNTALVNLKNFGRRGGFRLDGLKPFEGAHKSAQALSVGDAIVAKTDLTQGAEVIGRCLRMPALPQFEKYVASLDVAIVRSKGEIPQSVLCALLAHPEFRDHCLGFVNGTTVLHMSKAALETYTLPLLAPEQVANLADRIEALAGQQDRAFVELHHLQQLRDFLLPGLISGELRVADAEKTAEEVL